jgi:hypothetical protein
MSIRRRETKAGVRYDVQWRLLDRSKRKKTFSSERAVLPSNSKPSWSPAAPPANPWTHEAQDRARNGIPILDSFARRPQR